MKHIVEWVVLLVLASCISCCGSVPRDVLAKKWADDLGIPITGVHCSVNNCSVRTESGLINLFCHHDGCVKTIECGD